MWQIIKTFFVIQAIELLLISLFGIFLIAVGLGKRRR